MTDTFQTTFEPATPKAAKKTRAAAKSIANVRPADAEAQSQPQTFSTSNPPPVPVVAKQRRKRGPNKVHRTGVDADIKQMIILLKGLSKARRAIVLNTLVAVFG